MVWSWEVFMGKNRYLPFGYRIRNGEIVIEPVEANIVRKAFEEYAAGASYASIAMAFQYSGVRYHADTPEWNKNMVKRMLENIRYVGDVDYPQIIEATLFGRVASMRESRSIKIERAEKPVPTLSIPAELKKPQPSMTVARLQNEVTRALSMPISDPGHVKKLIFELAAERFKACLEAQKPINRNSGSDDIVAPFE
jgi:hypothetical protein